jgi:hypothetical protein
MLETDAPESGCKAKVSARIHPGVASAPGGALETGMRSILYEDNAQAIADLEGALR